MSPALLPISDLVHHVFRDEFINTDLQRCYNYPKFMMRITLLEFRFDSWFHEDYRLLGCDAVKSGRYIRPRGADFFIRWCTVFKISVKKMLMLKTGQDGKIFFMQLKFLINPKSTTVSIVGNIVLFLYIILL